MENLYRIQELCTSGWELINPSAVKLTKDQAMEAYNAFVDEGYNPNRLRIVVDHD